MANANPSRLGQANATGDPRALMLKVFAGEVMTAFDRLSVFKDRHRTRTIASGKSAQFPLTGLASAFYHTPGQEILGQNIRGGERTIDIDDLLIAPVFISNIDEALMHYDLRGPYSHQIGQALSKAYDQAVGRQFIKAARSAAVIDDVPGGTTVNASTLLTDGTVLWQNIFDAGIALDNKDIPADGRYAWMKPVQYALVVKSEKPINRDINDGVQNGSIAHGKVNLVNEIELIKANNMPNTDQRADTSINAGDRLDYSTTAAIVARGDAVGTVQLQDVTMETQYDVRRQGTLMVGKYLVGHGVLRAEEAIELRTGDPSP